MSGHNFTGPGTKLNKIECWFNSESMESAHQQSWWNCLSPWHLLFEEKRYENTQWSLW